MRRALLVLGAALLILGSVVATAAGAPAPAVLLLFLGVATAAPLSLPPLPPRE